jgi:gluconokinase
VIVVLMGVAGSGKTTVGEMLAASTGCPFLEGDALHSKGNIQKMRHGIPLTDADRAPWLVAIHARMLDADQRGQCLVVGCSALKQSYREVLDEGLSVVWVYLKGAAPLLRSRLEHRPRHFMKADMLSSQFEALEEPSNALVVDVSQPPVAIVEHILAHLRNAVLVRAAGMPRRMKGRG